MTEPPSPPASRLRQPSWLDRRLLAGVLLILASIVVGARVLGSADRTTGVWAVARDLPRGHALARTDLTATRARLFEPAARHYVDTRSDLVGRVLTRDVAAGELLTTGAVADGRPPARHVTISVGREHALGGDIAAGDQVDVLATYGGQGQSGTRTVVVLRRAEVVKVIKGAGLGGSGDIAVVVSVAPADVLPVTAAVQSAAIDLVKVVAGSGEAGDVGSGEVIVPGTPDRVAVTRMSVPVLTAVTDSRYEAELVHAFQSRDLGVTVVRRCVDLADLLAVAATGTARAVVVSGDLRRLDREALARLAAARVAVVGLVPAGDEGAERRLRQLGVSAVLPTDAAPEQVSEAVSRMVTAAGNGAGPAAAGAPTGPYGALPDLPDLPDLPAAADSPAPGDDIAAEPSGLGRLLAVWGPTGAPGRTTVAVNLAVELAGLGEPTVLADADTYGGAVAQSLGLLDEAPGLAAAARLANNGQLDLPGLARLARAVPGGVRVLTGISRAERWPELRPVAVEAVLDLCRRLAPTTVVDCGFSLEQDEELAFDQSAARRNGATLTTLGVADIVLAVGGADPVSLQRLVRGLAELRSVVQDVRPVVVVNRVRGSLMTGDPERKIGAALERYAGVTPVAFIPHDLAALDQSMSLGRSLTEAAPRSPARIALHDLARRLLGKPAAPVPRRLLTRRG